MSVSEILNTISLVSFVLAGISFLLAVFFWIRFNIPSVIGDLSGRTARKSIEKMRADNEKTGNKSYKPSKTNVRRGKLTETMSGSEMLTEKLKKTLNSSDIMPETGLLDENRAEVYTYDKTDLLVESEKTGLLQTDVLEESEETGLLKEDEETISLLRENQMENRDLEANAIQFVLLEEVMLIHTNETID